MVSFFSERNALAHRLSASLMRMLFSSSIFFSISILGCWECFICITNYWLDFINSASCFKVSGSWSSRSFDESYLILISGLLLLFQ